MPVIMIPARLGSRRLPQKLIQNVAGKPIILHVIDRLKALSRECEILVLTDSREIKSIVVNHSSIQVIHSPEHCNNGTERCAFAAAHFDHEEIIVNVQADELFVSVQAIQSLIDRMKQDPSIEISTIVGPMSKGDHTDYSVVKVLIDERRMATDFLRYTMLDQAKYCHHGIYAYRNKTLQKISKLSTTYNEKERSLEQMRWMDNGYDIYCHHINHTVHSINTLSDLRAANRFFKFLTE